MAGRLLAALLVSLASTLGGCERAVTSVGAWEPLSPSPTAGQSGAGGGGGEPGLGGAASGFYLEAEDGELSGGFTIESDVAASNGHYLAAPAVAAPDDGEGAAQARYTFTLAEDGDYLIWGRIYSPDIDSNRFHVRLDGGVRYLWRITVGTIWYWDDLHDDQNYNEPLRFQLSAGSHELVISNVAANARLDRLYVTSNGDQPPGNNTKCRPPHTIDLDGVCSPSCGAQATPDRATTCSCTGRPSGDLFAAYDCASGNCCFRLGP